MIRPFHGYVVSPAAAERVIAPVTEDLDQAARAAWLAANPDTSLFLMPDDPANRQQGRAYFERVIRDGTFIEEDGWWIYRISDESHTQTGILAEVSVAAYQSGRILRHEHTVGEVADHVADALETVGASTHPVSLVYRHNPLIDEIVAEVVATEPRIRLDRRGRRQEAWKTELPEALETALDAIPLLYIADGHHRSAAAAVLAERDGSDGRSHFLAVLFPDTDMQILSYHRCLHLPDHSPAEILDAIRRHFTLTAIAEPQGTPAPGEVWVCGLGSWYTLTLKHGTDEGPTSALDPSRLQHQVLGPICDVADPRADPRLNYVPGSVSLASMAAACDEQSGLSFVTRPPTIEDVMAVSDAGGVVPPKSTWFTPKVGAGMFLRAL